MGFAEHPDHAEPRRDETRDVRATVVAVIPEFRQAQIRAADGFLYALTETTPVRWNAVHEGQQIDCTVTIRLPRVVRAAVVA
jgi:hypothetical protein